MALKKYVFGPKMLWEIFLLSRQAQERTDGFKFFITYATGIPAIVSFSAVKTSDGGLVATSGDALTISWSVSDVEGLDNNPINISYTTNNATWKDITTNLDITTAANRTWVGGLSGNFGHRQRYDHNI